MTRGRGKGGPAAPARGTAVGVVAIVAVTAFYIGLKVELDSLARRLDRAEEACMDLEEKRVKLVVAIDAKKKSGNVRRAALEQLGMVQPAGWLELDR